MPKPSFYYPVFLDTGLQKIFVPLCTPNNYIAPPAEDIPPSLRDALAQISNVHCQHVSCLHDPKFLYNNPWKFVEIKDEKGNKLSYKFIRYRYGTKTWTFTNQSIAPVSLLGIWLLVETNTRAQDQNKGNVYIQDRGHFYRADHPSEDELKRCIRAAENRSPQPDEESPYIPIKEGQSITIHDIPELDDFSIEIGIRQPNGESRDVDLILDLGNTRTAAILFDHTDQTVNPENLKQCLKVLLLKPDPDSGEFNDNDDVSAGIASSWIVLHELDSQEYVSPSDSKGKYPPILQIENRLHCEFVKTGHFWNRKTLPHVTGKIVRRIPQMYAKMSPVLMGDQASRIFNTPYARAMVKVGAQVQQSSPKRYYWDDSIRHDNYWNMLLNDWDDNHTDSPANKNELPLLQGPLFRFIRHDGKPLDLSTELKPADQPDPYPLQPSYPRQSTLTWLLLHLLERAYTQANSSFAEGSNFIPRRLRKILITHPSGWTNDEVAQYRRRCQEALDIFSENNIYHGVQSEFRLEMVPLSGTADEAVAGQLPFVYSEIIRYPGLTAADWISFVGKKRRSPKGAPMDTVRIMNIDIGGGTTDISIIEYSDANGSNFGVSQNRLVTHLLFKDGQALAGDDLLKRIVEKIILGRILAQVDARFKTAIRLKFSQHTQNASDETVRGRIIRTCLIPLATYCLERIIDRNVQFSASEAGVEQYNWNEFWTFLGASDNILPFDIPCFSFAEEDINAFIDELFTPLFHNCAMYTSAFDVDMLIFSGKPSEIPYIHTLATRLIPMDSNRIIFARNYKAGEWYPFTDVEGCIRDAKTVTVVGGALYYAISTGLIAGWTITSSSSFSQRNQWGTIDSMNGPKHRALMDEKTDQVSCTMLPNTILARRQNVCCAVEPVYKFVYTGNEPFNDSVNVTLQRVHTDDGESLKIASILVKNADPNDFQLKLWPSTNPSGIDFWQDSGIFNLD